MIDEDAEPLARRPRLHELVAQQFSLPEGPGGTAIGAAMRLVNWLPNKRTIELLDIGPSDDVLEIGFGPGHALKRLCSLTPAGTVTGVDRSHTMFRQASARNCGAIAEGGLSLRHGSFESLPLPDSSVDRILAVNVIYFVAPLMAALSEARRVLRPGGTMALYVTDRSSMEWLQFVGRDTRHTFDMPSLARLLGASAFGSDEVDVRHIWLPFRFRGLIAKVTKRPRACRNTPAGQHRPAPKAGSLPHYDPF